MYKYYFDLIILDKENYVKYIPIIREFTKDSVSNIKNKIEKIEAVIICNSVGITSDIEKFYTTIEKLVILGASIEIREHILNHTKIINLNMLRTMVNTSREIDSQVKEDINNEVSND